MNIAAVICISLGVLVLFLGTLGIIRFPDFYSRLHAAGKCDTLGSMLIVSGLALHGGFTFSSAKIIAIVMFIFLTSPTATHVILRAAHKNKVGFWTKDKK